ncbi:non-ribosomal peptide synthetase [Cellulomonas phragmiteti]|uniref:Carrier domain-containing protein n=1 Tax=Cellulomonas phragmiteti TaxID=478780 RepID=A0ABQ4DR86_9CELL|nr:non-ribosomal peptide synthetase [Cellulomonas phragmiteti]GIG41864.1 hypothetical protein Cph01nite_36260 [Cellulomonas phragmiteti]
MTLSPDVRVPAAEPGAAPWDRLLTTRPGTSPSRVLAAVLAVVLDRHGAAVALVVDGDPAAGERALRALRAAGADATWDGVLDALGTADPGSSAAPDPTLPVVAVVDDPAAGAGADLCVWLDGGRVGGRLGGRGTAGAALSPSWCTSVLEHLEVAAQVLVDGAAESGLGRAEILTPRARTLNGGTPTRLPDYPGSTLHELFRLQAWRTPDAPALVGPDGELTYGELDALSTALAGDLVGDGVRPRDRVALCVERSFELFVGVLAVLKAGAVYVYLDPELPTERLRQQLAVSAPVRVLAGAGSGHLPPSPDVRPLPAVAELAQRPPTDAPDVVVGPRDPAYVLFTSGSTGVPKAVLRSHRLHTSRVFLEQATYRLGPQDRHLLKLPVSARELFWPLATGGACVVVPLGGERDDRRMVELMRDHDVSVLSIVPSMLRVLAARAEFAHLPALRHVFVGGEALHRDLEDRVRGLGYAVHTTFTLTEADYVTHRTGPVLDDGDDEVTHIGVPLDMRVYVCDEQGRRVPPGAVGEVWAGGPGLADGYLGNAEGTAARFVPNPFDDPQVATLFRSGDLARLADDGSLRYCGRRDLQVKVRGQRVEPTEVEHWIRAHPGVEEAAVVGYADREQGAVLVAFVATPGADVTQGELRDHLARHVPGWMVPRHVTFVPRLPQMPSGKIDRVALRLPERARATTLPAPEPAHGELEARVLTLWQRVLQLDEVGVEDVFVDVGGDSLRLLLLRSALQDELGVDVDAARLMAAPTVRAQAAMLGGAPDGPPDDAPDGPATPEVAGHAVERAARERARRAALRRGPLPGGPA